MSSTSGDEKSREFVDSNVLVYSVDPTAGVKAKRAAALLEDLWTRNDGCVSIQVLQEFFVVATRKLPRPLTVSETTGRLRDFLEWNLHAPGKADLISAIELSQRLRISLWDAMIVQSARAMRCGILWTEDLADGQRYAGVLARNPFLDAVMESR